MEIQEKICALCLAKCKNFEHIEGNTKNILGIFLPQMDFAVVQEPVMCTNCTETLAKCSEFKSTCLCIHEYLVSFANNKDAVKLDLKDVYLVKNVTVSDVPEDHDVCGFCLGLARKCHAVAINVEDKDCLLNTMVEQCLPDLDLGIIKKPVICTGCHRSLENCFRFVTNCLIVEKQIKKYFESCDIDSRSQIELSGILYSTTKTVTNVTDSNSVEVIKVKEEFCDERQEPEKSEVFSGVDIVKLEQIVHDTNNTIDVFENKSERFMAFENMDGKQEGQFLSKNMLAMEEEINKLDAIKVEEMCEDHSNDLFVETKGNEFLFDKEIEIKKDEHNINRFEEHIAMPQPRVAGRLYGRRKLEPNIEEELPKPQDEKESVIGKMYQCEYCSFQTKYETCLKIHLLSQKTSPEVAMYDCPSCLYQTKYKCDFDKHVLTHKEPLGKTLFNCYYCTFQTKYKYNIRIHMMNHNMVPSESSEVAKYECDTCTYQTEVRSNLKKHLLSHLDSSEIKMYKCDSCTYQTRYDGYLKRHVLKHKSASQVTMYKCNICSFCSKYNKYLKAHLKMHLSHK